MRTILALIFWTVSLMLPSNAETPKVVIIPAMPQRAPKVDHVSIVAQLMAMQTEVEANPYGEPPVQTDEEMEWDAWWMDAYTEHKDAFTAIFNATEVKWSKNGRLMVKASNANTFKFAAKGK